MSIRRAWQCVVAAAVAFSLTVLLATTTSGIAFAQEVPAVSALVPTTPPVPPGENAAIDSVRAERGKPLEITLITYGPSDVVWERFGHDAIAVRDTITGQDYAYNWGIFDFDQPNFVLNFLTGETNYWMAPYPTTAYNEMFVAENRTIRVQRLALTAVERAALLEFLIWNSQEANKFYRYDYYQDNCATRVRDALDRVLRGRLKVALDSSVTNLTWRGETARVTASNLPVYSGIELALGRNADVPLTPWMASFMPERLADAVRTVILRNEAGQRYQLVQSDSTLYESTRVPMPLDPPSRTAMAALLGLTLAGLIALLADSRHAILRLVLVTFVAIWYTVGGVLGTALLLAGTATKHAPYMGSNITLWQIHPLLLFAALFIPVALKRRQSTLIPRLLAVIVVSFSVFGFLINFVPGYSQHSDVVIAVALPVHLAIAVAVLRTPVIIPTRRVPAAAAAAAARAA